MSDDPIIRIHHVRQAQRCSRGMREWFQRIGLDYSRFLRDGYPCSVIERTGDAMGLEVAALARKEANNKQGGVT